ncbi:MAG: hypothetical protein FVQ83_06035 [Chloroflexi bacterium]|nr:hypothetical protein [Chloroflexota bacterium]
MENAPHTTTYCENHPDRETGLRCNRCEKLICAECAVHTPTGYRCKDCIRSHRKSFETAEVQDYILAFVVAAVLSAVGSLIVARIGFFTIFLAPAAGSLIAAAVRAVIKKRRSNLLFQTVVVGVVIGAMPYIAMGLFALLFGGGMGFLFNIVWQVVYTFMATSTVYYRLSGISLGR